MKRVSDILVDELIKLGLKQVFMITGGGAMHLNDAFGRRRDTLNITFNHHEQASAIAAESYCRLCGEPAVLNVTTGPGGINALNGVFGAYVDSIAMIVISGQVKRATMAGNYPIPLRQLGDQEVDIISMVKPIVKYAVELQDASRILEVIDRAVFIAKNGRPGPVWIDVPIDVQGALIDETLLRGWEPSEPDSLMSLYGDSGLTPNTLSDFTLAGKEEINDAASEIFRQLTEAKQPVLFGGAGVRISGCTEQFRELSTLLGIPTVTGWNAHDILPNAHPCYAGKPGTVGDRAGNFTVQNSDFLLVLGSRLNIRQVSYNWGAFAPKAWKAQIDIDSSELAKPTLNNNLSLQADLRDVMPTLLEMAKKRKPGQAHTEYLTWCRERVCRYPVLLSHHIDSEKLNPYYFCDCLYRTLDDDDIVITANGSACVIGFQTANIKSGTRLYTNSGDASMGYDLPAAIGAAVAGLAKRVICLSGDGSIMMNIQELQTIVGYNLPIKIFVLDNGGYLSIRQTQTAYFADNLLGIDEATGVSFPDFEAIGTAFKLPSYTINKKEETKRLLHEILQSDGPSLCHVEVDPGQVFEPKLASRKLPDGTMVSPSLEDMFPFLSDDEMSENRRLG